MNQEESKETIENKENKEAEETLASGEKELSNEEKENKEALFWKRIEGVYDEYYLSDFQRVMVTKFIKDTMGDKQNEKVKRIREWLFLKINNNKKPSVVNPMQRGCPDIIPQLRAIPWWDTAEFPWVKKFEEQFDIIRKELLALRNEKGFQPYRGPSWTSKIKAEDGIGSVSHDSGSWNVFYLFLHDMKFDVNCAKVPKTIELIESLVPRHYNHAFFSAVNPHTHIMKHNGPTNKKLRFHFPLVGFKGSKMRVETVTKEQEEGKCYIFDDSFEHEVWHEGPETRIILIIDFWHPDLSNEEVKFLTLLQKSQLRYERMLSEKDPDHDNYFSIIESSKEILKSNDWWTVAEHQGGE